MLKSPRFHLLTKRNRRRKSLSMTLLIGKLRKKDCADRKSAIVHWSDNRKKAFIFLILKQKGFRKLMMCFWPWSVIQKKKFMNLLCMILLLKIDQQLIATLQH